MKQLNIKLFLLLVIFICSQTVFSQDVNFDKNQSLKSIETSEYLTINNNHKCPNTNVSFSVNGDSIVSYNWNFGDGNTLITSSWYTTHYYLSSGNYLVEVTLIKQIGENVILRDTVFVENDLPYTGYLNLTLSKYMICPNEPFTFSAWINSQATMTLDFGDGSGTTVDHGTHTYLDTGTYIVTLTAKNNCGNDSSMTKTVVVTNSNPYTGSIYLGFNKLKVCPNQLFTYSTNVSSGNTFIIDFGDGTTSTQSSGEHSYSDTGVYTVKLTATNICGNDSSVTKNITVSNNLPYTGYLSLSLSSTKICPNQSFSYSTSISAGNDFFVDFGDSTTSDLSTDTHFYSDTGTYTITLTAINSCGNDSSISKTILVTSDIPYSGYMYLSINETEVCPNQNFNYYSTVIDNNFIIDFGDGTTSTIDDGIHSYSTTGLYTITLTATNDCGNDSSITKTIIVTNSIPFTDYIYLNINQTEVCPNQEFSYSVSTNGNSFIVDFGDGTTSTQEYGSHSYSTLGNHTITLTAYNECGNSSSVSKSILVTNDVQGNISLDIYENMVCPYQSFDYRVYSDEDFVVDFGDGTNSSNSYGHHFYSTAGTYNIKLTTVNQCGSSISVYETMYVSNDIPIQNAYMNASLNSACPNTQITFSAGSSNADSYLWNFGDSTMVTSSNSSISYSYSTSGTYIVSVKMSNYCGNDTTLYYTIYIENDLPFNGYFSLSLYPNIVCTHQNINYSISSSVNGTPYHYTIDYGDGTSGEVFEEHYYSTPGQYIVTLIATNNCGNSQTDTETITVVDQIPITNVSLNVVKNISCTNENIDFYTSSGNNFTECIWNFGDGTIDTSSYSHANHSYSTLGTYTVSLKLINNCNSDTTLYTTVNIVDTVSISHNLYMYISDTVICPNQQFYYNISSSYDTPYHYIDFGDGTNSTSLYATHYYSIPGLYTISYTASNYCGNSKTITETIRVTESTNIKNANLYVSSYLTCPNIPVRFEVYGSNIISYYWNFGDGNTTTSNIYIIEHSFSNVGIYQVSVKLTDVCGADTTLFYDIEISNNNPYYGYINLYVDKQVVCPNQVFQYYADTYGNILIDFGDGTSSTQPMGNHFYNNPGMYTIALTVSNSCNNDTTIYEYITVESDLPVFENDINVNQYSSCSGKDVMFSTGNGYISYLWNFGDGTIEYSNYSVFHHYNSIGKYNISLTITNQCGNQKTLYKYVEIIDITTTPYIYQILSPSEICPDQTATYSAVPETYTYAWDFGDGTSISGNNVNHTFSSAGTYVITVTSTNVCGEHSSKTKSIVVKQNIMPQSNDYFYGSFYNNNCTNEDIMFYVTPNGNNYMWDFGDGTTTTQTEEYQYFDYLMDVAYHRYSQPGTYNVHLTLSNTCGNSFTDSIQVVVKDNVNISAGFYYDYTISYRPGDNIDFFAAGGSNYIWNFGDGSASIDTTGIVSEISHIYSDSGVYTVSVIISNACGAVDTIAVNILIYPANTNHITSFDFLSLNSPAYGIIDNQNNTINITVPFGTNVTHLIPTITHTGVEISPATNTAQDFTAIKYYTVYAEDGSSRFYSVNVKIAPSSASSQKSITSFSFQIFNPAIVATINESAKTISATVPYGTILTNLVATFIHTGKDVIVNSIQQISGATVNDFTSSLSYTVIAEDASTATYVVNVVVTGIEELKDNLSINIYPNPNNGNFILDIKNAKSQDVFVKIYDVTGHMVLNEAYRQKTGFKEPIDISEFDSGIYIVSILVENKVFHKNIVVYK